MSKAAPKDLSAAMQERAYKIILKPHISEKAARLEGEAQYVFDVAKDANKDEIKSAIKFLFNVDVLSVNTTAVKSKSRIFKGRQGIRSRNYKKAYVRLASGQSINLFAKE